MTKVYWVIPDLEWPLPDRTLQRHGARLARFMKKVNIRVDVVLAPPNTPMYRVAHRLRRHRVARAIRTLDVVVAPHTVSPPIRVGWVIPLSAWQPPPGYETLPVAPWMTLAFNHHQQLVMMLPPVA